MLLTVTVKFDSLPLLPEQDTHQKSKWQKKDLLHAREPEQKKEIGSTCTPERNQDQQLHLTELKQQIQAILGSVDQVKACISRH